MDKVLKNAKIVCFKTLDAKTKGKLRASSADSRDMSVACGRHVHLESSKRHLRKPFLYSRNSLRYSADALTS